ncbi:MAG TPA: CmcI family methyltransferase [Gallionella sp.]|nr:CmcI family methyltransferase [Gallionella sp.]
MIKIDTEKGVVILEGKDGEASYPMSSPEAFRVVSGAWLRCGWDTKYVYSFSWMGRPIIQLPEDMVRMQEAIYRVKPDVVIETGVAHGGSLIYYASLFKAMGKGRVIGVDIEIRPHNRKAIEEHELCEYITLVEGSSTEPAVVNAVKAMVKPGEVVLVILDSNHSKAHVRAELEAYSALVSSGSYIVATDGIMKNLVGAPRSQPDWGWNNPCDAARDFAAAHPEFSVVQPPIPFNEGVISEYVTYWPGAWLLRG